MIYVSSACVHAEKIGDVLYMYSNAGIENIELSGGTVFYPELEDDLKYYAQKKKVNYVCHSYFPPPKKDFVVNLAACNDKIYWQSIDHYKNCIEMLKRLECRVLSIHAGFFVEIAPNEIGKALSNDVIYDKGKALDRFCGAYQMIDNICKQSGIRLYLENNVLNQDNYERFGMENLLMLTDYEDFKELQSQLEFDLLLDLAHLHVSAKTLNKNYEKQCADFAPYVKWIHMSENNGIVDQHKPLTEGSEITKMYQKYFNEDIPVTLETNGNVQEILHSIQVLRR